MSVFTNEVVVDGTVLVDGSAVTQPVSGTVAVSSVAGTVTVDASGHTVPVSGSVSVSNFPATQPVSGTVTANAGTGTFLVDGSAHTQPVSGTVTTTPVVSSSCTITRVATSNVAVTLLAANASRKKAVIVTETGTSNYIAFGSAASATNYTYFLGATATLEVTTWTGSISLVRSSGSGNVQVTEMV